ncbi:MAG TPA: hypothetical protein VF891_07690 [Gaiellaceae bacterium]
MRVVFRELDAGLEWLVEDEFLERCSHALVADGRVWLLDPVDGEGVEERIRAAGEAAGVIQLLDRHNRDCASLAEKLGVPHHVVPRKPLGPFIFRVIRASRHWQEVALWWEEQRVLACGDALGTARYYRAGEDLLAVHPLLRWIPPRRAFADLQPLDILCGHGEGIHEGAEAALREALRTARRRIPAQIAVSARAWLRAR